MIVSKSPPSNDVLPGPPGNSVSPVNSSGVSRTWNEIEPGVWPGRVDRVEAQPADLDHLGVVEEHVVADVAQLAARRAR